LSLGDRKDYTDIKRCGKRIILAEKAYGGIIGLLLRYSLWLF